MDRAIAECTTDKLQHVVAQKYNFSQGTLQNHDVSVEWDQFSIYLYIFMSHDLATQLGYSAGEFQSLQLIVLSAFGVLD